MKKKILPIILLTLLAAVISLIGYAILEFRPTIQFKLSLNRDMSPKEAQLLSSIDNLKSNIAFQKARKSAQHLALNTPYIEIGNCLPYPLVAKQLLYEYIVFKNSDTKPHAIHFTRKISLTLLPGEKKSIFLDFYENIEVPYGYKCDDSEKSVGIIYTTGIGLEKVEFSTPKITK